MSHVQPRCDDRHGAQANSHHSHFADTLRHRPDHRPRQQVSHKDSSRTTRRQTCARAKPKTHTNGRTKGNHGDVPGAETSLQLRLSTMVVDEKDFAMTMLIATVGIEGLLRRVMRDLLGVQTRHRGVCKSKRRAQVLQRCTANIPGWGAHLQGHFMPTKPMRSSITREINLHPKRAGCKLIIAQCREEQVGGGMLPCPDMPKAPRDRHAALIARDAC
jgi:hypothetical protein